MPKEQVGVGVAKLEWLWMHGKEIVLGEFGLAVLALVFGRLAGFGGIEHVGKVFGEIGLAISHCSSGLGNSGRWTWYQFLKSWISPSCETARMALAVSWDVLSSENWPLMSVGGRMPLRSSCLLVWTKVFMSSGER